MLKHKKGKNNNDDESDKEYKKKDDWHAQLRDGTGL